MLITNRDTILGSISIILVKTVYFSANLYYNLLDTIR